MFSAGLDPVEMAERGRAMLDNLVKDTFAELVLEKSNRDF